MVSGARGFGLEPSAAAVTRAYGLRLSHEPSKGEKNKPKLERCERGTDGQDLKHSRHGLPVTQEPGGRAHVWVGH